MEKRKIERILRARFNPVSIQVVDDSHLHSRHLEAKKTGGGHYSVTIVASEFKDKTTLERHRMVYDALSSQWTGLIHALAIKADAPPPRVPKTPKK